jgi:hypothetical protein
MRATIMFSLILQSIAVGCSDPKESVAPSSVANIRPPYFQLPSSEQATGSDKSSNALRPTTQVKLTSSEAHPQVGRSERREVYEEGDFVLNEVPLQTALVKLADHTRGWFMIRQINVDWDVVESAGVSRTSPVTVRLWSPKVSKALRAVLDSVSRGEKAEIVFYDEGNSCIRVTTRDRHLTRDGLVREYRIHRFLFDCVDDPPAGEHLSTVGWTRRERTDAIAKLIKETVHPESWSRGEACSIGVANENLVIRQVEENHRLIQNLFEQMDELRSADVLNARVRPTTAPATTRPVR